MSQNLGLIGTTLYVKILVQIISGVIVIVAAVNLNYFRGNYKGVISNWNQDLPFELSLGTQFQSGPSDQILGGFAKQSYAWNGTYEGVQAGCYCYRSDSYYGVSSGMHSGYCDSNQTAAGCDDSEPIPETAISVWDPNEKMIVHNIVGSSFSILYQNMDSDGTCKPGTVRCGSVNSISQGLCVPESWGGCPVSDVRIGAPDGVFNRSVKFARYEISYATSNSGKNPIADFHVGQYQMCENPNRAGLTPGRTAYSLDRASYTGCKRDERYTPLDSRGEKTLFDINRVDYSRTLKFYPSDAYTWSRFTRRVIEWRPNCLKEVPTVISTENHISKANTLNIILTVFSVLLNLLNVGLYLGELIYLKRGGIEEIKLKQFTCMRIIFLAILLPMLWVMFFSTKPVKVYFEFLVTQSCSDSQTNETFEGLYHAIDSRVFLYNFLSAVMGLTLLCIEMGMFICRFCNIKERFFGRRTQNYHEPHVSIDGDGII